MLPETLHRAISFDTSVGGAIIGTKRSAGSDNNVSKKRARLSIDAVSFKPHPAVSTFIPCEPMPRHGPESLALANSTASLENADLSADLRAKLIANVNEMIAVTRVRPSRTQATTLIDQALPLIEHEDVPSELELKLVRWTLLAHSHVLQSNESRQFVERSVNLLSSLDMDPTDRLEHACNLISTLQTCTSRLSAKHAERLIDAIITASYGDTVAPERLKKTIDVVLRARAKSVLTLTNDQDEEFLNIAVGLVARPDAVAALRMEMAQKALRPENWQSHSEIIDAQACIDGMIRLLSDETITTANKNALTEITLSAMLELRLLPLSDDLAALSAASLQAIKLSNSENILCAKSCELLFDAMADKTLPSTPDQRRTLARIAKRQAEDANLPHLSRLRLTIDVAHALRTKELIIGDSEKSLFIDRCLELVDCERHFSLEQVAFLKSLLDDVASGSIRLTPQQKRKTISIVSFALGNPRLPEPLQLSIADAMLGAKTETAPTMLAAAMKADEGKS